MNSQEILLSTDILKLCIAEGLRTGHFCKTLFLKCKCEPVPAMALSVSGYLYSAFYSGTVKQCPELTRQLTACIIPFLNITRCHRAFVFNRFFLFYFHNIPSLFVLFMTDSSELCISCKHAAQAKICPEAAVLSIYVTPGHKKRLVP